jgi:hypothetical protein
MKEPLVTETPRHGDNIILCDSVAMKNDGLTLRPPSFVLRQLYPLGSASPRLAMTLR